MYEKILIADDEEGIVTFVRDALIRDGYDVLTAYNGEQAVKLTMLNPSLIILDIMMPGKDGYEVCQEIRDKVACPIIYLSALQNEADKIKGLALGGDDYLTKPFSIRELKARIEAHLRREKRSVNLNNRSFLRFGDILIDLKGHEVYLKDTQVIFTKKEFDIIEFLVLHPGMVFTKEQIYEKVWGYDAMGDSAGVAEHIKKIRSKLNEIDKDTEYISTVWGVGYKWERIK
ncbi:MAG: response regulator transcription factor [Bacillota bacterium]|nr:response regulator transcription factor [Bacillota bacterium]